MFERQAGLLSKLKDATAALDDCTGIPDEDLLGVLQPLHFRILSLLREVQSKEIECVGTPSPPEIRSGLSLDPSTQQSRANSPSNQRDSTGILPGIE